MWNYYYWYVCSHYRLHAGGAQIMSHHWLGGLQDHWCSWLDLQNYPVGSQTYPSLDHLLLLSNFEQYGIDYHCKFASFTCSHLHRSNLNCATLNFQNWEMTLRRNSLHKCHSKLQMQSQKCRISSILGLVSGCVCHLSKLVFTMALPVKASWEWHRSK
jgi:hypothetical protein